MAAKINDGLFIGDADTSQDPEFLELNKISNLVNLSGKEVPNVWSSHGLVYLTYNWDDTAEFKLFDNGDDVVTDLMEFIDTSLRHGVSVLLFSRRGVGRCAVAVCAYLMVKYRWGFEKTYDYVFSKKPDIDINRGFIQQLFVLDKQIRIKRHQFLKQRGADLPSVAVVESKRWKDWDSSYLVSETDSDLPSERSKTDLLAGESSDNVIEETPEDELLLINSFLNSKQTITSLPGPFMSSLEQPKVFVLRFNSELQEQDIQMFRTEPPRGRSARPAKGALKGARLNAINSANTMYGNGDARYENINGDARVSNSKVRGNRFTSTDDDIKAEKDSARSATRRPVSAQRAHPADAKAGEGRGPGRPASSGSKGPVNDDLYQFIGLGSGSKTNLEYKEGVTDNPSRVRTREAGRAPGKDDGDAKLSLTAEERLRHLVSNMQQSHRTPSNQNGRSIESNTRPASAGRNAGLDDKSTPTLYDLANMSIQGDDVNTDGARRAQQGRPVRNLTGVRGDQQNVDEGGGQGTGQGPPRRRPQSASRHGSGVGNGDNASDPLAAFEMMQQGGVVRAVHNINMLNGYEDKPERTFGRTRNAWDEESSGNGSRRGSVGGASNDNMPANLRNSPYARSIASGANKAGGKSRPSSIPTPTSSGKQTQQGAPKLYRHGSPAPNRQGKLGGSAQRGAWTGSSGGSAADQQAQFSHSRYSTGGGSNASIGSIGSNASGASYMSNTRRSDSASRRQGAQQSVPQRSGSASRDRPASPSMRRGSGVGTGSGAGGGSGVGMQRRGSSSSYDNENSSVNSRQRAPSPSVRGNPGARSGTPTRQWRF